MQRVCSFLEITSSNADWLSEYFCSRQHSFIYSALNYFIDTSPHGLALPLLISKYFAKKSHFTTKNSFSRSSFEVCTCLPGRNQMFLPGMFNIAFLGLLAEGILQGNIDRLRVRHFIKGKNNYKTQRDIMIISIVNFDI